MVLLILDLVIMILVLGAAEAVTVRMDASKSEAADEMVILKKVFIRVAYLESVLTATPTILSAQP